MQQRKLPDGNFRDRLEQAREGAGLSPAELARQGGLSPTAVSRYRNGARAPNADELLALASALGVTMEWLLTGQPDPKPPEPEQSVIKQARSEAEKLLRQLDEVEETTRRLRSFLG